MARKPVLLHTVVLASYALVAFIFTFPLVQALRTRFPGQGTDVFGFIWNNWWTYYSLTELHVKPYFTDFIRACLPLLGLWPRSSSFPRTSFIGGHSRAPMATPFPAR